MTERVFPDGLAKLREPFADGVVGKLPKPKTRDAQKGKCQECGGWHGLPAVHLDYVGHAAVTDRLLTVDPAWTWEPLAVDQTGNPALDRDGNLWIRLTVCGVTRIGVGDGANMKERIGDALRNAAMRFGVALSLWSKEELESGAHESFPAPAPPQDVSAKDAKNRIYKVFRDSGLDVAAAKTAAANAWERGEASISEADLQALIAVLDAGRPFVEAAS